MRAKHARQGTVELGVEALLARVACFASVLGLAFPTCASTARGVSKYHMGNC